ncbi:hypothetical protein [Candidatus Pelagisphaera phototrophica]|uniref:hypothetical protein n=1 Tax=Candidatus Pelagisphaera phototrophica TaxID=2684113 RepID=UPI0019E78801|nr:hypothetical protein [Candidatus Pelagisphaera phototrophica]QXD31875.1 hypothetical protein GA004_16430 [Candidatus Pelagisphaera phototrophica]
MTLLNYSNRGKILGHLVLLVLGLSIIGVGWMIPSRFKSIPRSILSEAGARSESFVDLAQTAIEEENYGIAEMNLEVAKLNLAAEWEVLDEILSQAKEESPVLYRWGVWDPFLDAALKDIPLSDYSAQPGILGVGLSNACRRSLVGLLENSRDSTVKSLLDAGELSTYKRLFPVSSVSGKPLESTLVSIGLLVQGDRLTPSLKRELRSRLASALASGDVAPVEDFFLDTLSLARTLNWSQFRSLFEKIQDLNTISRLRYAFHRRSDKVPLIFVSSTVAESPQQVMDYLGLYGDEGVEALESAVSFGVGAMQMLVREKLPLERAKSVAAVSSFKSYLIGFSLQNPGFSLVLKYSLFFFGALLAFWGSSVLTRSYRESSPPLLSVVQRLFVSLVSVIILVVLSEPHLARSDASQGYSFKFVLPVLAEVNGETIIIETEPTTSMEPTTLLSVSFFFILQILVFLICLLKVRQIEREDIDSLVKLRLMENEENLFDSGLYVGIAGTCISLVLQVLGLIEANLIAAYSSNLFGILGVAIVKIRLVRPYKNKLIMDSQERIASLSLKA